MNHLKPNKLLFTLSVLLLWSESVSVYAQPDFPKPEMEFGHEYPLVEIGSVSQLGDAWVFLTGLEPSIHIFEEGSWISFGEQGNGPGEFKNAVNLRIHGDDIFALDFRVGAFKIIQYNKKRDVVSEYPLGRAGVSMCFRFEITNKGDKILEIGQWADELKDVVLLNEDTHTLDSLILFQNSEPVKIKVPEGPMQSWSFTNPYQPTPKWALNEDDNLLFWDGKSEFIETTNIQSGERETLKIPKSEIKVEAADIDRFLDRSYALDAEPLFGHENPYKFLRKRIRDEIESQSIAYFPQINAIMPDAEGGVWLLRANKATGQIWSYLSGGKETLINLPKGESMISIQKKYLVLKSQNQNNEEILKFYPKNKVLNLP